MVSFTSLIALLGAGTAILGGIFISPLPKQIGFYRFLASQNLQLVGLTPAFHYGTEWNYSFERLHQDCTKIAGQNALVTGANSGVGYETAKALAKCGVNVTLGCRSVKKCAAAVDSIKKELPTDHKNEIIPMIVDMSSLKTVQSFSKEYLNKLNENDASLDMLYLNAGIANSNTPSNTLKESALSEDGIELIFATNYVGHHLMYRILEPLLKKSKMARVIQTSSAASFETFDEMATSLEILNSRHDQDEMEMKHYGQSKLAQILWSKYLTKLMGENSTIYFNALHPGAVDTGIWGKNVNIPSWLVPVIDYARRDIMWTAEEGALTQIYLGVAVDELAAKDIRGKYFHPQVQEVVNERALNETLQEELWKFSEDLVSKFL
jgi:NAD(P)-dependent dehydrogenase (short-subunit alcohol dehydrogenase family)